MRRGTAVLATCLCAITACRGGAAQEPYDGVVGAAARGPSAPAAAQTAQVAEAEEPLASEVNVPWAIALLSDEAPRVPKRPRRVVVIDREIASAKPVPAKREPEVQVVVDHDHGDESPAADEKPATPKACSGVVNRRS